MLGIHRLSVSSLSSSIRAEQNPLLIELQSVHVEKTCGLANLTKIASWFVKIYIRYKLNEAYYRLFFEHPRK